MSKSLPKLVDEFELAIEDEISKWISNGYSEKEISLKANQRNTLLRRTFPELLQQPEARGKNEVQLDFAVNLNGSAYS